MHKEHTAIQKRLSIRFIGLVSLFGLLFFSISPCVGAQPDNPPDRKPPGSDKVQEVLSELGEMSEKVNQQVSSMVDKATEMLSAALSAKSADEEVEDGSPGNRPVVYLLPIEGEVRPIMMALFKRGLEEAKDKEVDLVLLEMDTPGGELRIAEEISQTLLQSEVHTATWIKKEGLSAGMLIAISTERIYMKPVISSVGDCQPIFMTTGEIKEAPEKILTNVRRMGRTAARKNGYNVDIVNAMIDEGKSYVSEDGSVKCGTGELLTLTGEEAVEIGFARGLADSVDEVLEQMDLGNARIKKFEKNWAESLAAFIASPAIASLLTLVGLVCLFIEYKTPGFGLFGGVGLACLGFVFWGHSIAYLAGNEGLLLFLLGLVLLGVEIFLIPGFGLAGAAGLGLIIVGLIVTFLEVPVFDPLFMPEMHLARPLLMVGFSVVGSILLVFVVARYLPELKSMEAIGISLPTTLNVDRGFSSHDMKPQEGFVGRDGTAVSALKPSGIVLVEGTRLNVVTEGEYVEAGEKVRVVKVDGFRVVVQVEKQSS